MPSCKKMKQNKMHSENFEYIQGHMSNYRGKEKEP